MLTKKDVENLISCLRSKQVKLTLSGDYPEKTADKILMKKLIKLKYELKKTQSELIIISD